MDLWGNEITKADIRELYKNYWVLVDNVNAKGKLSCHWMPEQIRDVKSALKEIERDKVRYCGWGEGEYFDASTAKLLYSKDGLNILAING
jgi:hypothetical protein